MKYFSSRPEGSNSIFSIYFKAVLIEAIYWNQNTKNITPNLYHEMSSQLGN